jgi:hypothetical protein
MTAERPPTISGRTKVTPTDADRQLSKTSKRLQNATVSSRGSASGCDNQLSDGGDSEKVDGCKGSEGTGKITATPAAKSESGGDSANAPEDGRPVSRQWKQHQQQAHRARTRHSSESRVTLLSQLDSSSGSTCSAIVSGSSLAATAPCIEQVTPRITS